MKTTFHQRVGQIAELSSRMRNLCVESQFDAKTGLFLEHDADRRQGILSAIGNEAMFESMSDQAKIGTVTAMQSAVRDYERTYGELPRDEIFASAFQTVENMMLLEGRAEKGSVGSMMLESIGNSLSESTGVEIRARMVGLVLPVLLETATLDAVTMIPAGANEAEIFKVYRRAGSNFGGYKAGDLIDQTTLGQYTSMKQRYAFKADQLPDGTKTEFVFDTKTDLPNTNFAIPFKKGSASVWVNRKRVAREAVMGQTTLVGTAVIADINYTINVAVDRTAGKMTVSPTSVLPAGVELYAEFEVDIESKPELIPIIDHDMDSRTLYPSQNVVAADATVQAMFTMQREFNTDLKSMQMSHMRNTLAAEKSQRHLEDFKFITYKEETFNIYTPSGEDWRMQRERLHEVLLHISQKILAATNTTGMTGMYAGGFAANILKSLGAPHFIAPANYRETNAVHYAGKLFGVWKVYQAPVVLEPGEIICYGRGASHSEAGYVAGDAIAATMYTHPIGANLKARNTLYELAYGEVHPFDGEEYFYRLNIIDEEPVA
ncbi:hypothetical protein [Vibrio fluvialis]|uniref:hypothetical protein n=2 Tax=Vibrio fluvialis TaxID=676 RepID=UPI001EE9F95E|nr:hypothetical protein [Vibrio fluvialis]MCG6387501.1 hypothetical protein [Vibrio fluvialis]